MKDDRPLFSVTRKDFEITWFSGTGNGGQNRNRHKNCCRIKHIETGVIGTGQSQRDARANQKEAFRNVVENPRFKAWLNGKVSDALFGTETIDRKVDEAMSPENIKIEYIEEGKWKEKEKR